MTDPAAASPPSSVARPLLVIIGPTASGKSDLAMAVARATGAAILSVDSMQVYRGMDIGTAKPSAAERAEVRHHGLDLVDPAKSFTVARFVEFADDVIRTSALVGIPLIATGGTPLYYKALFEGLFEGPSADPQLRERLGALSKEELHARLRTVDPAAALRIHLQDTRRMIRALEVHETTGRSISSFQTEWAAGVARHPAVWVGLDWDRDVLNRRINTRVKAMMSAGWLDETRRLLDAGPSLSRTAAEATGYHELIEHLAVRMSLEDAIEQIKIATRQLARKQMKWFRRFRNVRWLPGDRGVEENAKEVMDLWNSHQAGGRACESPDSSVVPAEESGDSQARPPA